MLTRPLARKLTRPLFGGVEEWVDPLEGIPFALRLQTHRGDGVPLGLYQDAAATILATEDGHPVGAWKDELSGSGVAISQGVSGQRPTLRFVSGFPVVRFDGSDDRFQFSDIPFGATGTVIVRQATTGDGLVIGGSAIGAVNHQLIRLGDGGNNRMLFYDGNDAITSDTLAVARGIPNTVGITRSAGVVSFHEGSDPRGSAANSTPVVAGVVGGLILNESFLLPTTGDIRAVLISSLDLTTSLSQISDYLSQI